MEVLQKSRTNETLLLTSALIVLQRVGTTTHCFRLMYRQSYIKQDLRYTGLDQCIDCPTKSRTYATLVSASVSIVLEKQGLRYNGLDHCIDIPTAQQDQRFVGLKAAKIVGLSTGLLTRHGGLLIDSVGLQVCRTITRRNIDTHSFSAV